MAKVRVSVANLAPLFMVEDSEGNLGPSSYFGIPNPKKLLKDGVREYQALGGGAQLTEAGVKHLQEIFGATDFEIDKGIADARFLVDEDKLEAVFAFFRGIAGKLNPYEIDPTADIYEELVGKEFGDHGSIMSESLAGLVSIRHVNTVAQKVAEDGVGTSERAQSASAPTRRLFRRYAVVFPESHKEGLVSPLVKVFTNEELATTNGGATKGKTLGGEVIRDNLFI